MTEINIRKYENTDYADLCLVHDLARKQELVIGGAERYFTPLDKAPYREDLFSCKIWVAEKAGKVVGFVAVHLHELDYIYVLPDEQGQGLGLTLARVAMTEMTEPIKLEVFAENKRAKQLYSKLGFVSQRVTYDQWDPDDPKKYSCEVMILK